jgi:antitoxin HigA-1
MPRLAYLMTAARSFWLRKTRNQLDGTTGLVTKCQTINLATSCRSDKLSVSFRVDTYYVTGYKESMIRNIRHRGLRALYEENDPTGVNPQWAKRLQILLTRLEASTKPSDMALPGLRLHPLRGNLRGLWAVNVSGN